MWKIAVVLLILAVTATSLLSYQYYREKNVTNQLLQRTINDLRTGINDLRAEINDKRKMIAEKEELKQLLKAYLDLNGQLEQERENTEGLEKFLLQMALRRNEGNTYRVTSIYFYPKDLTPNPLYPGMIDKSLAVVQAWYSSQLNGPTFEWDLTLTVQGRFDLTHYQSKGSDWPWWDWNKIWWGDLTSYGFPIGAENRVFLVFMQGSGDFGGGNLGLAALGDGTLQRISGENYSGEWWQNGNAERGAIAHELGHAFGLPHPPNIHVETLMGTGWIYFPKVKFLYQEIETLRKNPFFK